MVQLFFLPKEEMANALPTKSESFRLGEADGK
jgi:hypothetical protein